MRGPSENRNKKERERNVVLSFFNKNDGKNLRKLSRMQGTSVIDDAETSKKIRSYPLRTRIYRGLIKNIYIHLFTLHRTQTDVTFVKYFIMFHGHRKLIINYNFYEYFVFYESPGKLLEGNKKLTSLRISDRSLRRMSSLKAGQS